MDKLKWVIIWAIGAILAGAVILFLYYVIIGVATGGQL